MGTLVDHVRRFRQLRALVIGDAMLDSYLEGTAVRLCAEGPVPVVRKLSEERAPGGAANTAANLRALGAEVTFLGIIGPDPAGMTLRSLLQDRGIDDRWLVEDRSVATLHKLRILSDGHYVVRFDEGETRDCSSAAQEHLLANLRQTFPRCDLIVVSDYDYGVASDRLIDELRKLRAVHPRVLVVDSKNLRRFHQAGATLVTPNYLEACRTVEPTAHYDRATRPADVEQIGRRLLALINAECAAITLAGDGVVMIDCAAGTLHIPAHAVAQVNDVGAGDSFAAAVALALAAGAGREASVRIGVDAAGIAVTKRRTAVVGHQELLQRVSLAEQVSLPPGPQAVAALATRLETERLAGRTIVFTNGVFDILHAGHVEFLRRAKGLGDILVVGVNSDRSARQRKGESRLINRERDRLALVTALDPVDHAVLFDEETPARLIRALRPHIHVKGGDYADESLPEAEAVQEVGGRVVILPLSASPSSSDVIDRILTLASNGTIGVDQ
jgi:D-beta-D-heptose 7-phosphate kinase/D-beta-D-heptose 1-phosphate adenosyltransferase